MPIAMIKIFPVNGDPKRTQGSGWGLFQEGIPMKVFLSHASEDVKVATAICLALRGAGHDVFFDNHDLPPGGDYNTRIRNAIDTSDATVFLVSPYSVDAGSYTLSELKFAKRKWPTPVGGMCSRS